MDDRIVLYNLIDYIKSKNSHGKNELIDFIINQQIIQIRKHEEEQELYLESRRLELNKMKEEV